MAWCVGFAPSARLSHGRLAPVLSRGPLTGTLSAEGTGGMVRMIPELGHFALALAVAFAAAQAVLPLWGRMRAMPG